MLFIVINLFVQILLFAIYLSFLVIINSFLSARDSWVGRGRGLWEIVLPPQLERNPRGNTELITKIIISDSPRNFFECLNSQKSKCH